MLIEMAYQGSPPARSKIMKFLTAWHMSKETVVASLLSHSPNPATIAGVIFFLPSLSGYVYLMAEVQQQPDPVVELKLDLQEGAGRFP